METRGKTITLLYWSHQSWLAVAWITSAPRAVAEICCYHIIFKKQNLLLFLVSFLRAIPVVAAQIGCTPGTKSTGNTSAI